MAMGLLPDWEAAASTLQLRISQGIKSRSSSQAKLTEPKLGKGRKKMVAGSEGKNKTWCRENTWNHLTVKRVATIPPEQRRDTHPQPAFPTSQAPSSATASSSTPSCTPFFWFSPKDIFPGKYLCLYKHQKTFVFTAVFVSFCFRELHAKIWVAACDYLMDAKS